MLVWYDWQGNELPAPAQALPYSSQQFAYKVSFSIPCSLCLGNSDIFIICLYTLLLIQFVTMNHSLSSSTFIQTWKQNFIHLVWSRNLLLDEGGHLKIGEYWVQMLYNQRNTNQDSCKLAHPKLSVLYVSYVRAECDRIAVVQYMYIYI